MPEDSDIRQIIVMRKDLGMRKGKMIAQGAHASMKVLIDQFIVTDGHEEYTWILSSDDSTLAQWIHGLFTKICVGVASEEELLGVYKKAQAAGLLCALIQDAGLTEFKEPTYTCCAIGPATKADLDPITGHLKLL